MLIATINIIYHNPKVNAVPKSIMKITGNNVDR